MRPASTILGPESPLRSVLDGFIAREQQLLMAEVTETAMASREHLLIEAGTGTGKTFAYLVPALLGGRRTIVSTGTRALQDQLFHRDLPTLAKAIGQPVTIALLKGRSNYLCLERLATAATRDGAARYRHELAAISRWSTATDTGDRREVVDVADDSPVWPWVTSTLDNCLGQKCPQYERCFVTKARRNAQAARIVVVNHHLLLADLAMKEAGFDQFLPGADAFIVDEAHQLPDIAGQFLGTTIGTVALATLLDEATIELTALGGPAAGQVVAKVATALARLRDAASHDLGRYDFGPLEAKLGPPLATLTEAVGEAIAVVDPLSEQSVTLENFGLRLYERSVELARFADVDSVEGLRWIDVGRRGLRLNLTPLDTSAAMAAMIAAREASWVLTSATLAVGEDFSHFASRLGLGDARTVKLESPYPLAERSLLYLPSGLPAPAAADYPDAVMAATTPLLGLTQGGAFFLFTSYRALNRAADWLAKHKSAVRGRRLLTQGAMPRDALLRTFRAEGNAVLLATGTFWEGVDVPGSALSLVVIDKLPFASPGDPLLQARIEQLRRLGENPFTTHQLPQAVLALKQGVGRLLRDARDYGVVALCDPRLSSKAYGKAFLDALAPMPVASSLNTVRQFYRAMEAKSASA